MKKKDKMLLSEMLLEMYDSNLFPPQIQKTFNESINLMRNGVDKYTQVWELMSQMAKMQGNSELLKECQLRLRTAKRFDDKIRGIAEDLHVLGYKFGSK